MDDRIHSMGIVFSSTIHRQMKLNNLDIPFLFISSFFLDLLNTIMTVMLIFLFFFFDEFHLTVLGQYSSTHIYGSLFFSLLWLLCSVCLYRNVLFCMSVFYSSIIVSLWNSSIDKNDNSRWIGFILLLFSEIRTHRYWWKDRSFNVLSKDVFPQKSDMCYLYTLIIDIFLFFFFRFTPTNRRNYFHFWNSFLLTIFKFMTFLDD